MSFVFIFCIYLPRQSVLRFYTHATHNQALFFYHQNHVYIIVFTSSSSLINIYKKVNIWIFSHLVTFKICLSLCPLITKIVVEIEVCVL